MVLYFNSRPCGRGDGDAIDAETTLELFQFTPLREGRRTHTTDIAGIKAKISIHAPAGGATAVWIPDWTTSKFQFTPLREGRRRGQVKPRYGSIYFNSRPCGRGDHKLE